MSKLRKFKGMVDLDGSISINPSGNALITVNTEIDSQGVECVSFTVNGVPFGSVVLSNMGRRIVSSMLYVQETPVNNKTFSNIMSLI